MRRSVNFTCEGETLVATLDEGDGSTGLLIVTGGRQTRIGPHRMMAMLAAQLSAAGYPVFRFDRRGAGDSSGIDPGFRNSAPDIAAAATAFRSACPHIERLWGMGLCDGASAIALHHGAAPFDGLILLNPWVIEASAGQPAPAAIRAHYRERLLTLAGWRKLLTQGFSMKSAMNGIRSALSQSDQSLAHDVMASLAGFTGPIRILLAERDATARAFRSVHEGKLGEQIRRSPRISLTSRNSASHSFASGSDQVWLAALILAALRTD